MNGNLPKGRLPEGQEHFLDISDLTKTEARALLDDAHARKKAHNGKGRAAQDADAPLKDRVLAMVFENPSTRTRLSFDLAIRQLGGRALILNHSESQLGRGESIADTARVLSRYADAIMVRTQAHDKLREFANAASVPVINGLTDFSHPCQIIADLLTFEAHKGAISGRKLAWIGDGNNVAVSFMHAAVLFDFNLHLALAPEFHPPAEVIAWAQAQGDNITIGADIESAAQGADALITDCWVSMNDAPETAAQRARTFAPFQIDQRIMALGNDAIFMHCLPAYRDKEVAAEVLDSDASLVFEEAENRIYAQKAILTHCLGTTTKNK